MELKPCGGGFDVAFLVQSSKRDNNEADFQRERNALSEIAGRFNLGYNKVHLAHLYYGKKTRRISTLSKKDQSLSTVSIKRAQQLPYIPYEFGPIPNAFAEARRFIFNNKRENSQVVPRIAVLLNESPSNNLAGSQAEVNILKQQNIEVFTIGVGSKYDSNELRQIASTPENFVHIKDFGSIFDKVAEITQRVCTVQAKIEFNTKVNVYCDRGELRYFKASVRNMQYDFIGVYKDTLMGTVDLHHSFTTKNPTSDDHGLRMAENSKSTLVKDNSPSLLFEIENNSEQYVYLTVECMDSENEVTIWLENTDF